MIDKDELKKDIEQVRLLLTQIASPGTRQLGSIKGLIAITNRVLSGELVEVMNIEEIDKKILKSISAYWKIEANDVGRELLVIPADKKQVCQAIHDRLKRSE